MKTIYKITFPLLLITLFIASCSKDIPTNETAKKGSIGFETLINEFIEGGRITDALPNCSSENPLTVCVGIKDANGEWILDQTPLMDNDGLGEGDDYIIEIDIAPASAIDVDSDGDNDTWFTEESESLELPEGDYTIEYFVVKDVNGDAIFAAPHEEADFGDVEYQNFVTDALPIALTLFAGTKKYVDVEVLCFEEHFAKEFGYLFFDVIEIEQQHVCIFGNVCDSTGRHFPANFRAVVWESDPLSPDGKGDLLFDGENVIGVNAAGEDFAEPLCIPLPDREGIIEEFYGEIYLIENGILGTEPIREGIFDENAIKDLYVNSDTSYYWHFREGCETCDDEPRLLEGCIIAPPVCVFDFLDTMLSLGVDLNQGDNPPNIEGIYLFDAITLLESNIPGDFIGSTFSNVKVQLTNQVPTASGSTITFERKNPGAESSAPVEAYVTGTDDDFTLYACITSVNMAGTDSAHFAYIYSATVADDGWEDVTYVLLNVDDFGDPDGTFIQEGEGRYFEEADGLAEEVFDFNLRIVNNARTTLHDLQAIE